MRAAAANPQSARLVGIRVGWMVALGWGMSAAIGAVAGMLIAPVVFLEPNMMLGVLLYGFAGAVLGGLSSPGGAVIGGFAVGVIENLAGTFIPYVGRELKLTIALVLIVAVLMVRPAGHLRPRRGEPGMTVPEPESDRPRGSSPAAVATSAGASILRPGHAPIWRSAPALIAALAAPLVDAELRRLPADPGHGLRAGDPRPQSFDRVQRPILARAQRVLRDRRLHRRRF